MIEQQQQQQYSPNLVNFFPRATIVLFFRTCPSIKSLSKCVCQGRKKKKRELVIRKNKKVVVPLLVEF